MLYSIRNRRHVWSDEMKKSDYDIQYAREHLKRVALDLTHDDYAVLQKAAAASGESVNAYIKRAVALRLANDYDSQSDAEWTAELKRHDSTAPSNRQTIVNMFNSIMSER